MCLIMSKKYQPTHQWVKDLKLKGGLAEILDSATDHIGQLLDSTNMRDYIYLASFLGAVYLAYITLKKVTMTFPTWISMVIPILGLVGTFKGESVIPPITTEELDWSTLAQSMVIAYILLKIDADDIASAITKIGLVLKPVG